MAPSQHQHLFPLTFPHAVEQLGVHKGNQQLDAGQEASLIQIIVAILSTCPNYLELFTQFSVHDSRESAPIQVFYFSFDFGLLLNHIRHDLYTANIKRKMKIHINCSLSASMNKALNDPLEPTPAVKYVAYFKQSNDQKKKSMVSANDYALQYT